MVGVAMAGVLVLVEVVVESVAVVAATAAVVAAPTQSFISSLWKEGSLSSSFLLCRFPLVFYLVFEV